MDLRSASEYLSGRRCLSFHRHLCLFPDSSLRKILRSYRDFPVRLRYLPLRAFLAASCYPSTSRFFAYGHPLARNAPGVFTRTLAPIPSWSYPFRVYSFCRAVAFSGLMLPCRFNGFEALLPAEVHA